MKRLFTLLLSLPVCAAAAWGGYGAYLAASQPKPRLLRETGLAVSGEKTLPFYELMSPIPELHGHRLVPKLEYKKGPPKRYIERISLVAKEGNDRERIVYHGRRTRTDLSGIELLPAGEGREGKYLETALLLAAGEPTGLPAWKEFLLKPLLLREARSHLSGVAEVRIMEQAGEPAFLFIGGAEAGGDSRASALFVRRNSFYRVDYLADHGWRLLDPIAHFRKSFLVEKRADALTYLAQNLSAVRLEQKEAARFENIAWPILLLAANVSVDPASLEAYFHFAGISALLYRSLAIDGNDAETLDILRNNVLAAEFYAKDVNPQARKTAEISRLARLLTRNFD